MKGQGRVDAEDAVAAEIEQPDHQVRVEDVMVNRAVRSETQRALAKRVARQPRRLDVQVGELHELLYMRGVVLSGAAIEVLRHVRECCQWTPSVDRVLGMGYHQQQMTCRADDPRPFRERS